MARYRWYHAERKNTPYALVDPISPPVAPHEGRWGGGAGTAPGPMGLLRWPFIAIAACRQYEYARASGAAMQTSPGYFSTPIALRGPDDGDARQTGMRWCGDKQRAPRKRFAGKQRTCEARTSETGTALRSPERRSAGLMTLLAAAKSRSRPDDGDRVNDFQACR